MKKTRWIKEMTKEAARTEVKMPWQRGERRAAWIAKRNAPAQPLRLRASA